MPIEREILNMLDVGQEPYQLIPSPSKVYNRKEKVFRLCDEPFRSLNYGHRQASIALWVHPLRLLPLQICLVLHSGLYQSFYSI